MKKEFNIKLENTKSSFNEDELCLFIQSELEFNEVKVEIDIYNYPNKDYYAGQTCSKSIKSTKLSLQSFLLEHMLEVMQIHKETISNFIIKLDITIYQDGKLENSKSVALDIVSPWKIFDDIYKGLFRGELIFQEIPLQNCIQNFKLHSQINLLSLCTIKSLTEIKELKFELLSNNRIKDASCKVICNKKNVSEIINLEPIANNKFHFLFQLTNSLDVILKKSFGAFQIESSDFLYLNIEISYINNIGKKNRSYVYTKIPNVWKLEENQQRVQSFILLKDTLNTHYPQWKGDILDSEKVASFSIDNIDFDYSLYKNEIDLSTSLGEISYDYDYSEISAKMKELNKKIDIDIIDQDNFFILKESFPISFFKKNIIKDIIGDMLDISKMDTVKAFANKYKTY